MQLDELGDEPAELRPMESCLVDFELTDHGTFRLRQFGDETLQQILDGHPSPHAALASEFLTITVWWCRWHRRLPRVAQGDSL